MNPKKEHGKPSALQLTAYVDGELDQGARAQVEDWLANHPQVAAAVEAQRRLSMVWQTVRPTEPTETAWAATFSRIEAGLNAPVAGPPAGGNGPRRRVMGWSRWVANLVAAAAVVLAVAPGRFHAPPERVGLEALEPFPVASEEDVDINSLDAADAPTLVVGEPPVRGPLALATPRDVSVQNIEADSDGMRPEMRMPQENSAVPMIVAPLGKDAAKDDEN